MAKARRRIRLECTGCKRVNYFPNKSKLIKANLEISKHCKFCGKHTKHKQTK